MLKHARAAPCSDGRRPHARLVGVLQLSPTSCSHSTQRATCIPSHCPDPRSQRLLLFAQVAHLPASYLLAGSEEQYATCAPTRGTPASCRSHVAPSACGSVVMMGDGGSKKSSMKSVVSSAGALPRSVIDASPRPSNPFTCRGAGGCPALLNSPPPRGLVGTRAEVPKVSAALGTKNASVH